VPLVFARRVRLWHLVGVDRPVLIVVHHYLGVLALSVVQLEGVASVDGQHG